MRNFFIVLILSVFAISSLQSLTGFAESAIFEINDETLPVTLSNFMASPNTNTKTISINWTSQSETNLIGYHIHRSESANLASALKVTSSLISAQNTSLTSNYSFRDTEVESEKNYYYWLQSIDYSSSDFYGPVSARISEDTDVPSLQQNTELVSIYPNPFSSNTFTNIALRVKENETSQLSIYNIKGQLVKRDMLNAGEHIVEWHGLDNAGKKCSNGIYFVQLQSASYSKTSKILLIK